VPWNLEDTHHHTSMVGQHSGMLREDSGGALMEGHFTAPMRLG
jgi:hypothetical protein